jgi:hypothetical protein
MIPTDISGCSCWVNYAAGHSYSDAGVTPATANGTAVQQINDETSFHNNWSQATLANRVTIDTTENAWKWNGGQFMNLPNIFSGATGSTGGEIIVLLKVPATNIVNGIWKLSTVTSGFVDSLYTYSNGLIYETGLSTTRKEAVSPTVNPSTAYRVYSIRSKDNLYQMWLDNALQYSSVSNGFTFDTAPYIGKNVLGTFWTGWIKQFAAFPFVLDDTQRIRLTETMLGVTYPQGNARDTQEYLDAWVRPTSAKGRVTQEYLDAWTSPASAKGRITQEYLDAWTRRIPYAVVTQEYLDVWGTQPSLSSGGGMRKGIGIHCGKI